MRTRKVKPKNRSFSLDSDEVPPAAKPTEEKAAKSRKDPQKIRAAAQTLLIDIETTP